MTKLSVGQSVAVTIEKPAAGGRMIARLDGRVLLVSGAIPGERVTARIERIGRGVVYAATSDVLEPSADRREPFVDCACGGLLYAHIEYARQLAIKALVVADAFGRVGHLPLPTAVPVAASPEHGYRMRARVHVRDGRPGFFREGTHTMCDARATRQLLPAAFDAVDEVAARLRFLDATGGYEVEVSENVDASERALYVEREAGAAASLPADPVLGSMTDQQIVTDRLSILGHTVELRRHVLAFFQGNRYLLEPLVASVVDRLEPVGTAVDLYAGVGVFAVAAAVCKGIHVTAVEGDRVSAADLRVNADRVGGGAVRAVQEAVESFGASTRERPDAVIVDPPRTGMSREALEGAIGLRSQRVVYVSCDVATLARDARRLVDAGYSLTTVDSFDLFPNTPHVETVAVFER